MKQVKRLASAVTGWLQCVLLYRLHSLYSPLKFINKT
jgi:hypothetical protein